MAIGVWEPRKRETEIREVDAAQLQRFIQLVREGQLDALPRTLGKEEIASGAALMKLEQNAWKPAEQFSDEELELLIRFFTRAEMVLPGWEGGKHCPAIWLVKILRARDAFTPELRQWIRQNSENRYLPYGSVL